MTEMATEAMHEQLQQPKSIFDKFKNNLKNVDKSLKSQKEEMKLDDALLGDNTFFKFLNDLLNSLKKKDNLKDDLLKELKTNEALGKEKLFTIMTNELEQNQTLSKEAKEQIGKNMQNKYVQDLTSGIVKNKLDSQEQGENAILDITTKDVVKAGMDMAKNPTPLGMVKAVGERAISKMMHKMTK